MKKIRIGLIGTGYMGKAHAIAFKTAPAVFSLDTEVTFEMLAEVNDDLASTKASELGFRRSTGDWRQLVTDPDIDIVDICSPNYLHKDMALAAIAAGKHVYCEKPLAMCANDALEITLAAEQAGVKTLVGFNYAKNPTIQLAREIIQQGEIGEVVHFRSVFNEDYLADPDTPFSWRLKRQLSGSGALNDLGSHIVNLAQHLVAPINEVCADSRTVHRQRSLSGQPDNQAEVENEDLIQMMLRFSNGATGSIEASRIAWGRKNGLWFEVTGTKGSLIFDQERLSELHIYQAGQQQARQGFKRILTGPEHPDYMNFCVSAGHGLGYNDMKAVEVRDLLQGVAADQPIWPDFRAAYQDHLVLDAAEASCREQRWVKIPASVTVAGSIKDNNKQSEQTTGVLSGRNPVGVN
ncbi:Gfo/Idh/MocA family protein [Spongorhabdus nitratireducens]